MHFSGGVVYGKAIAKREKRVGEFCKYCGTSRACGRLAFSANAWCRDLIGKVSGEIAVVACLQFGPLPIFAGKNATTIGRAAFAFHFVAVVVRHAPIMGQFFPSTNIANADERNVTAQAEVGVAGMITVERGTLPFCLGNRRDE